MVFIEGYERLNVLVRGLKICQIPLVGPMAQINPNVIYISMFIPSYCVDFENYSLSDTGQN